MSLGHKAPFLHSNYTAVNKYTEIPENADDNSSFTPHHHLKYGVHLLQCRQYECGPAL